MWKLWTHARMLSLALGLVLATLLSSSCRTDDVKQRTNEGQPAPRPFDPLTDDARFDVIDMLPARAGGLRLARIARGKSLDTPPDDTVRGRYDWARRPGARVDDVPAVDDHGADAEVVCYRRQVHDQKCDDGSVAVKVGERTACFYPEDRRCKRGLPYGEGAAIMWPGCLLTFECGAFKYKPADAVASATDIERWASWFRGGRRGIPRTEVLANRKTLAEAVKNH